MTHFLLINPWGETALLLLVGIGLSFAHRKGWIEGKVLVEVLGFLLVTIAGFFIPGVIFFIIALLYVLMRLLASWWRRRVLPAWHYLSGQ